jgi:hypothetical protein
MKKNKRMLFYERSCTAFRCFPARVARCVLYFVPNHGQQARVDKGRWLIGAERATGNPDCLPVGSYASAAFEDLKARGL